MTLYRRTPIWGSLQVTESMTAVQLRDDLVALAEQMRPGWWFSPGVYSGADGGFRVEVNLDGSAVDVIHPWVGSHIMLNLTDRQAAVVSDDDLARDWTAVSSEE